MIGATPLRDVATSGHVRFPNRARHSYKRLHGPGPSVSEEPEALVFKPTVRNASVVLFLLASLGAKGWLSNRSFHYSDLYKCCGLCMIRARMKSTFHFADCRIILALCCCLMPVRS